MATSGLSCRRALGPAPCSGAVPETVVNGLAGPAIRPKKNADTTYITRVAHRITGSAVCRRYRQTRMPVNRARANPHSRMEPASADHMPVIE